MGNRGHKTVKFLILREARRVMSRTATLDVHKVDFDLYKDLLDGVPCEVVLKDKGVQEGWTFFRNEILRAPEQVVPMCRKTSHLGRRPAWLIKENLLEFRKEKEVYDFRKKGQETQKDYRDAVRLYRKEIGSAKAQLEFNL